MGVRPATAMMREDGDLAELTQLGRFVKEKHVKAAWLAEQVGVSTATVSRWCWGRLGMSQSMRGRVLEVLQQRARDQEPPLELLDDQLEAKHWAAAWGEVAVPESDGDGAS